MKDTFKITAAAFALGPAVMSIITTSSAIDKDVTKLSYYAGCGNAN